MFPESKIPKPHDAKRSGKWRAVRTRFLAANPKCAGCGGTDHLEAHHRKPFHLNPALELDPANLIVLCETPGHNCHFHFGHLLDWHSFNVAVAVDAAAFWAKVKGRP